MKRPSFPCTRPYGHQRRKRSWWIRMIKIGYSRWRISLRIGKVMKKERGGLLLDAERRLEVMRKTIGYWQHTIGMLSEG
jgi:hypothetical protein